MRTQPCVFGGVIVVDDRAARPVFDERANVAIRAAPVISGRREMPSDPILLHDVLPFLLPCAMTGIWAGGIDSAQVRGRIYPH